MKDFSSLSIQAFLEVLGSSSPAPGGGSVAAICASLASRLTEMVANLTIGRDKFASGQEAMSQAREIAKSLSDDFMNLAKKDTEAFNLFMKTMSLPKETDEERRIRKDAMQWALKESTLVPLEILSLTRDLSANSLSAAIHGNPNAVTDVGVSALLAEAAAKGAAMNARVNLSSIHDSEFAEKCFKEMEFHLAETSRNVFEVLSIVDSKLNGS
ncbi:MAG: cyclodeaminase/cyclohydrolase family protein [Thermovirgaceae bacterium]|nr:cyclodeaminase/cyclohydrolase family protein [Thermovirgaceae bacterium]